MIAMATTNDVRDALSHLTTAEFETSDLSGGLRVALSDDEAGQFFKAVRENGFNAETKRLGDTLVSHIEAEKSGGLSDLFG
jgi:hypothetical protein